MVSNELRITAIPISTFLKTPVSLMQMRKEGDRNLCWTQHGSLGLDVISYLLETRWLFCFKERKEGGKVCLVS